LDNYTQRCHIKCGLKALWMDPEVRELAALSAFEAAYETAQWLPPGTCCPP